MKIRTCINQEHLATAEVVGKGFLGAHVNLENRSGSENPTIRVHFSGHDINDPRETLYLKWKDATLQPGDLLQIEIMPLDKADEPSSVRSSRTDKKNLEVTGGQADLILEAAYHCNNTLQEMLMKLKGELNHSEFQKIAFAVGTLIDSVFTELARPVYRRHPEKVPEVIKDGPL